MAVNFIVASFAWGLASAIAVAAIGTIAAVGGRSRPRGAFAFAAFAWLWAAQIALGNVASVTTDRALAGILYGASSALLVAIPFFLVEFAASHGARPTWLRVARWATVGFAALTGTLLLTVPGLLLGGLVPSGGYWMPQFGPLHVPLVAFPFFASFAVALLALEQAKAAAPTARVADRIAMLVAGLGVYVAYSASNNLVVFLDIAASAPEFLSFVAVFVGLTVVSLHVLRQNWRAARAAAMPVDRRRARLLTIALGTALAYGAIEGLLVLGPAPDLHSVGLWRLGGLSIIAYGIARWRLYDLPQRASRAAATAVGATAATAAGAATYGAGTLAVGTASVPAIAGVLVVLAALLPALNVARRLFGVSDARPRALEESLYGQRIDSYRAALEASLARGSLLEDGPFLAALRERFHITEDEDRVLTHLAKSSVIVARDRDAWDAYERLRLLGEGGGGRTWLARDRARDRLVVLKEPLERWQQEPSAREAVLREARLAAKVRHPNVVAVEEVVEGKGSPVIVMEYLEGGSLGQVLRARGTLKWSEARALMLDVLGGLEAVHASGIVHRDIKPTNILLTGEGAAKVADFGIAVAPQGSGARTMVIDPTHSTIAGTLHYMAPEARAGATPDRRADVYSCAALLHEMLYGAPPGLPSPTVVRNDLPAGVPALLARALAVQPEARIPTARAFADELAKLA